MPDELTLEPHGDRFLLRQTDESGVVSEIILTEKSVLHLAQSSLQMRVSILGQKSRPGVGAVVVTPIVEVALNVDLERSSVHLTLFQADGTGLTFGLGIDVAKPLSEKLPRRVAELEAVSRTVQ